MPRLRIKKDYNYDATVREELGSEDNVIEIDNEESSNDIHLTPEREDEGQGTWLSSANIITKLSDKRIKEAIRYHRENLQLLQSELSARESGLKSHITTDWQDYPASAIQTLFVDKPEMFGLGPRSVYERKLREFEATQERRESNKKLRQIKTFARKLNIPALQQEELIKQWEEILQGE